jgi:hypothetical protein
MAIIKFPESPIALSMTAPLPPIGMAVVSWPWKLSKNLQDWSLAQLRHPLGTIVHDIVDGHPIVAQLQVHDTYGAHPEWGIKPHKGTSIYVPAVKNENGKLVAIHDPPEGWASSVGNGSNIGFEFNPLKHLKVHVNIPFVTNAVATAGRAIGSASNALDKETGKISHAIQSIPVAGPLLHGVLDVGAGPFRMSEEIGRGKRLDKVVLSDLKRTTADAKEVAPYVQAVIGFVPGIGTAASAAIGAATALAEGKPIDEIMVSAVAGAVPGGGIGKVGYELGKHAMEEKLSKKKPAAVPDIPYSPPAGGSNVGAESHQGHLSSSHTEGDAWERLGAHIGVVIPDHARATLSSGLHLANTLASGVPMNSNEVESAIKGIADPTMRAQATSARSLASRETVPDVLIRAGQAAIPGMTSLQRKQLDDALKIGMTMGHAQRLQSIIKTGMASPVTKQRLNETAKVPISRDVVMQSARSSIKSGSHGFDQAVGLMQYQITQFQYQTARAQLNSADKRGFDIATALHIGRVSGPPAPLSLPPRMRAAYHITHGMLGAPVESKQEMMSVLTSTPLGKAGAVTAINEIAKARRSWWAKLLSWLHLEYEENNTVGYIQ